MAKEINYMALGKLSNNGHFAFTMLTVKHANECDAVKTNAAKALAALTAARDAEDAAIKLATKNDMSDHIADYDKQRDDAYITYRTVVKGYTYMRSGDFYDAALRLTRHIRTNNVNTRSQYDVESSAIYNLVQDLQSTYAEDVKKLGLTDIVAAMKEANDKVLEILGDRDADNATKVAGAVKSAREVTDAAYEELRKTVNALALLNGDADYASFIDTMNEQNDRYREQILGQSSSSSSSSTDDNSSSTDDSSSDGGDSSSSDGGSDSGNDGGNSSGDSSDSGNDGGDDSDVKF